MFASALPHEKFIILLSVREGWEWIIKVLVAPTEYYVSKDEAFNIF